jgi:hypothetical protein
LHRLIAPASLGAFCQIASFAVPAGHLRPCASRLCFHSMPLKQRGGAAPRGARCGSPHLDVPNAARRDAWRGVPRPNTSGARLSALHRGYLRRTGRSTGRSARPTGNPEVARERVCKTRAQEPLPAPPRFATGRRPEVSRDGRHHAHVLALVQKKILIFRINFPHLELPASCFLILWSIPTATDFSVSHARLAEIGLRVRRAREYATASKACTSWRTRRRLWSSRGLSAAKDAARGTAAA